MISRVELRVKAIRWGSAAATALALAGVGCGGTQRAAEPTDRSVYHQNKIGQLTKSLNGYDSEVKRKAIEKLEAIVRDQGVPPSLKAEMIRPVLDRAAEEINESSVLSREYQSLIVSLAESNVAFEEKTGIGDYLTEKYINGKRMVQFFALQNMVALFQSAKVPGEIKSRIAGNLIFYYEKSRQAYVFGMLEILTDYDQSITSEQKERIIMMAIEGATGQDDAIRKNSLRILYKYQDADFVSPEMKELIKSSIKMFGRY